MVLACVSDSPAGVDASDDGSGPGNEGKPCYANGTCNPTLTCISNVCVQLGTDAGSDAPAEAATDSGCGYQTCPVQLTGGQSSPSHIAIDTTNVYWTDGTGTVMKLAKP